MSGRERFGLWLSDFVKEHGHPPDIDDAWKAGERQALERAALLCDEYGALMASEKDSALLVGKVDLSNAMSGEPRAAEFIARAIRALIEDAKPDGAALYDPRLGGVANSANAAHASTGALYTMDQMRDYAQSFHRSRMEHLRPRWVSVKDRLPDSVGTYLLYRPEAHFFPACDPNVTIRSYHGDGGFGGYHEVTHWMPLPAAPTR